jgi:hypothetical protein
MTYSRFLMGGFTNISMVNSSEVGLESLFDGLYFVDHV